MKGENVFINFGDIVPQKDEISYLKKFSDNKIEVKLKSGKSFTFSFESTEARDSALGMFADLVEAIYFPWFLEE